MKSRIFSVLALIGVAGALGVGPATAQLPNVGTPLHQYYYYSDAAHTQWVGGAYEDCAGFHYSGTITQYKVVEEIGVCKNGIPYYW